MKIHRNLMSFHYESHWGQVRFAKEIHEVWRILTPAVDILNGWSALPFVDTRSTRNHTVCILNGARDTHIQHVAQLYTLKHII